LSYKKAEKRGVADIVRKDEIASNISENQTIILGLNNEFKIMKEG